MATELELATLAYMSYQPSDESDIDLFAWSKSTLTRPQTDGFAASVYSQGNEVVIAFRGTDTDGFWDMVDDFANGNVPAANGTYSSQIAQAIAVVADVMAANPGKSITFTGHSLGGGIASVMSAFFGKRSMNRILPLQRCAW